MIRFTTRSEIIKNNLETNIYKFWLLDTPRKPVTKRFSGGFYFLNLLSIIYTKTSNKNIIKEKEK
jgi:hypothetical protein